MFSPGTERVSAVIPHYGDPAPTLALVDALRAQTSGPDLEVVVSDDASPQPFPQTEGVTVVRRECNGGFGANVNSGAAAASGDLLLVLNSDLEIGPTFVADLVAAAAPWQPCVAGPATVRPDGSPDHTARHFPRVRHQAVEWLVPLARWRHTRVLHEAVGHDTRAVPGRTLPVDWLVGAAILVPTAEFRAVGGFDERFFMNAEEVDLQRRLRGRGVPSVYCGTVHVVHEGGGSSGDGARRRAWLVEGRTRYAQKWGGRRRLRAALTAASVVNLGWDAARAAAGRPTAPLRTFRREMAWIHRPGADGLSGRVRAYERRTGSG